METQEVDSRAARKAAIHELVMLLQNKSPDEIRFTASILRQVLERGEGTR
ncbi:MAG: hypothetical protein Q7T53_04110 [Deltaproteobacteria bacterium]|nr:hypothetical protein [Deltaproteobacteria bacterium]